MKKTLLAVAVFAVAAFSFTTYTSARMRECHIATGYAIGMLETCPPTR